MEFLPKEIDDYVLRHTPKESEILSQINRETHLKVMQPRMLSGHFQGQLLKFLVEMIEPKTILEIGTYTGYSAIAMAEGLPENGILTTIDTNVELEKMIDFPMLKCKSQTFYPGFPLLEFLLNLCLVFDWNYQLHRSLFEN